MDPLDPLVPLAVPEVPQRPDTDQPLEPLISVALEPVLWDLRVTGGPSPRIADERWGRAELQATAMLWGERAASGVSVTRGEGPLQQVVSAADGVQEWAIDELWGLDLGTNWPACPLHPLSHPLRPEAVADVAVWSCPSTGTTIAPVGGLERPGLDRGRASHPDQPADTRYTS